MVLARALLPSHDCASCTPALQKQRGCEAPPAMPAVLDGEELDRCPLRPYKEDPSQFDDALQAYAWYRRGMLPDPGTVLDQSGAFLAVVAVLDRAVHDVQALAEKREKGAMDRAAQVAAAAKASGKGRHLPRGTQAGRGRGRRG